MGLITVTLSVLLMMRMTLTRSVAAQMIENTAAQYFRRIVKLQQHGPPGHQLEITGPIGIQKQIGVVGIRGRIGVVGIRGRIGVTGILVLIGVAGTQRTVTGIPEPGIQVAEDLRKFPNCTQLFEIILFTFTESDY